jgi:hypothetical protein
MRALVVPLIVADDRGGVPALCVSASVRPPTVAATARASLRGDMHSPRCVVID